jgi:ribose transport system permease protein
VSEPTGAPADLVDDVTGPATMRSLTRRALASWRLAGILIPFVILFVVLSIASSSFLHKQNLIDILSQQAAIMGIAAAGTLVLVSGGLDLSVGATYGLAQVVAGEMNLHHQSPVFAIAVGILAGVVVGLVNGVIVTVFRISPMITTLAMSFVVSGVALKVTAGNLIVLSQDSGYYKFAYSQFLGVPSSVWMAVAVVVVLGLLLSRTTLGRYTVAAGGNAEAARLAGVRVTRTRIIAYTLSGGAAGLGGVIDMSRLLSGQAPTGGGFQLTFTVLAGIVVGGTSIAGGEGSVWRTTIGVLFIALIGNGIDLLGIDPLYQNIVLGVIILLAVGIDAWTRQRRR